MLTTEQINDLHRLYWFKHWPIRKIERHLNMGWKTIRKYLAAPAQGPVHRDRPSKLDPFKDAVAEWLEKDPGVSAAVIEQKLCAAGYQGGHSILREGVRNVRPHLAPKRAFVRMKPLAGERFEVDWGHFGALSYAGDMRRLYAFALVDAHSRMLYVEFTHSQSFETFARCHMPAIPPADGKREKSSAPSDIFAELLAAARVHRSARYQSSGPAVAGRGRQSTLASRDPQASARTIQAGSAAAVADHPLRLPRLDRSTRPQGPPSGVRRQSLLRPPALCRPPPHHQGRL